MLWKRPRRPATRAAGNQPQHRFEGAPPRPIPGLGKKCVRVPRAWTLDQHVPRSLWGGGMAAVRLELRCSWHFPSRGLSLPPEPGHVLGARSKEVTCTSHNSPVIKCESHLKKLKNLTQLYPETQIYI